jgi:hypothetical protein
MAKEIEILAPVAVTHRIPFVVSVELRDVTPGRRITVTLERKSAEGRVHGSQSAELSMIDGDIAFTSFQVSLPERGSALLLATARDDSGGHFHPNGVVIEVL